MATVFSYIRFSSGKQAKGSSLERQTDLRNQWLADHPEHNLDTTLRMRDLGVSAFKGANLEPETGDLGKFIWLAQHDKKRVPTGCILLLERLDRFSRDDALKAVNVLTGLILAGVTVVTLDPVRVADLKTGGKMEILLPMVMDLIIANEYSSNLSLRVTKGWEKKRARAAAGECKLTGQCPRWLRLIGNKFEPIPERVKVLRHNVTAGLMRLVDQAEAEKKPLAEVLREAIASQIAMPTSAGRSSADLQPISPGTRKPRTATRPRDFDFRVLHLIVPICYHHGNDDDNNDLHNLSHFFFTAEPLWLFWSS